MQIECSICTDGLSGTGDEVITATRCGHIFHEICLKEWIERAKTCPQCRKDTDEKEHIRLYFPSNSKKAVVTPAKASSKILPVQNFKDLPRLSDRERELRTSVKVAIDTLTLLQDKITPIRESENLAEDSVRNSVAIRSLLSTQRTDAGGSILQNQLKTTEKKVKEALTHIEVFREKMFVVSRSLVEVMDNLNLGNGDIKRTNPGFRKY